MKLVRYGNKGSERPGMLDGQGAIRDLSAILQHLIPGSRARVAVIRGEQLGYGILEMKNGD